MKFKFRKVNGYTLVETTIAVLLMAVVGLAVASFMTASSRTIQSVSNGALDKMLDYQEVFQAMSNVAESTDDIVIQSTFSGKSLDEIVVGLELIPMKSTTERLFSEVSEELSPKFVVASVSSVSPEQIFAQRHWSLFSEAIASDRLIENLGVDANMTKVVLDYKYLPSATSSVWKTVKLGMELFLAPRFEGAYSADTANAQVNVILSEDSPTVGNGFTKATLLAAKKACKSMGGGHRLFIVGSSGGTGLSQWLRDWPTTYVSAGLQCLDNQCPSGFFPHYCINRYAAVVSSASLPPTIPVCIDSGRYYKNPQGLAQGCEDKNMEAIHACPKTATKPQVVCSLNVLCDRVTNKCLSPTSSGEGSSTETDAVDPKEGKDGSETQIKNDSSDEKSDGG